MEHLLEIRDMHYYYGGIHAVKGINMYVDKGEIVECGTPEELMALKGKYYKLIEIQSMGDLLRKKKEEENFE